MPNICSQGKETQVTKTEEGGFEIKKLKGVLETKENKNVSLRKEQLSLGRVLLINKVG